MRIHVLFRTRASYSCCVSTCHSGTDSTDLIDLGMVNGSAATESVYFGFGLTIPLDAHVMCTSSRAISMASLLMSDMVCSDGGE